MSETTKAFKKFTSKAVRDSMRWRTEFAANSGYYVAMGMAAGIGLLKSFGYGLILAPAEFGRLSLLTSLVPVLVYGLSRGAIEGAALHLPRLYGVGEVDVAAQLLRRCVQKFGIEGLLASAVSGLVYLLDERAAIISLAVPLAASTGLLSLTMTDARSRGAMNLYGGSVLARVVACSACGLPGAALFGIKGAVCGEVVAQIFLIVWLLHFNGTSKSVKQVRCIDEVRGLGRKMMSHQFLQMLLQNGDRWIIAAALGPALLGQYSFAAIFLTVVALLHAIIYQQIGPAALRALAKGQNFPAVLRRYNRTVWAAGASVALLGGCGGLVYWLGLSSLFSNYAVGFKVFPLIVLTGVFQIMNQHDWIISAGPHMGMLIYVDLVTTFTFFGLALAGWVFGWPLVYFAMLSCGLRLVSLLITLHLARLTENES